MTTDMTIETSVETITPELAEGYLYRSAQNRPVRPSVVERYAREMAAKRWQIDGQAIKFNAKGELIDGQHRLNASLLAKVPFETLVVRNLEEAAFDTQDQGATRRACDYLALQGEDAPLTLERTATLIWRHENVAIHTGGIAGAPTVAEIMATVERHPKLRESIIFLKKLRLAMRKEIAAGLHYLFGQVAPERANEFFLRLADGVNLAGNDPIYLLRERLAVNITSKNRLSRKEILALVIKAWNAWNTGEKMKQLKWQGRGRRPSEFPSIAG